MKLELKRIYKGDDYTIGKLYINSSYFCDTLEDKDRGLTQDMPLEDIKKIKVAGKTAIPTGTYQVSLDILSPKFSDFKKYNSYKFCDGHLPRLINVPGFEGVLIHIGNDDEDTDGCILVGTNSIKGKVTNSTSTFRKLYDIIVESESEITIDIS